MGWKEPSQGRGWLEGGAGRPIPHRCLVGTFTRSKAALVGPEHRGGVLGEPVGP